MKQLLYIAFMLACIHASAQPSSNTEEKLVAQKENIIKEGTIINERPELKAKVMEIDPSFLQKAEVIRKQQLIDKAKLLKFQTSRDLE